MIWWHAMIWVTNFSQWGHWGREGGDEITDTEDTVDTLDDTVENNRDTVDDVKLTPHHAECKIEKEFLISNER